MKKLSYWENLLKEALDTYTTMPGSWYYLIWRDFLDWLEDSPFNELGIERATEALYDLESKGLVRLERSRGSLHVTYVTGQTIAEAEGVIGYQQLINPQVNRSPLTKKELEDKEKEYKKYLISGTILDALHERSERGLVEPISPESLLEWGRNPRNWGWDDLKEEGIKPTLKVIKDGLNTLLEGGHVINVEGKFITSGPSWFSQAQDFILDKAEDLAPSQRKEFLDPFIEVDPGLIDRPPFRTLGYPKPGYLLEDKFVKDPVWEDYKRYPNIDPETGTIDVNTLK